MQLNINRNQVTTENVLQLAIELNIQILAIQEPWVTKNSDNTYRTINHPSFNQILPNYNTVRPRVV